MIEILLASLLCSVVATTDIYLTLSRKGKIRYSEVTSLSSRVFIYISSGMIYFMLSF